MKSARDGLTTKIHALVYAEGLPILLTFTESQAHDRCNAQEMFDTVFQQTQTFLSRSEPATINEMTTTSIACSSLQSEYGSD